MKWLRTITGVVENVVSMFRQVDTLIQRIQSRQYIAKVIYQNGLYKVTVVNHEGNSVDGVVLLYLYEPNKNSPDIAGYIRPAFYGEAPVIDYLLYGGNWKTAIARIPKSGGRFKIGNNERATLRACVLGVEQGI